MNKAVKFVMRFIELAQTAIERRDRGVLGVILFDDTVNNLDKDEKGITYYSLDEVEKTDWSDKSYKLISLAFKGSPFKVVIKKLPLARTDTLINKALKFFEKIEPNYFAMPQATDTEIASLKSWAKTIRNEQRHRVLTIKLVIKDPEGCSDFPYIINIGNNEFETKLEGVFTAQEYTICRAGVAAGISLMSSLTYFEEGWLKRVDTVDDLDAEISNGQQITIYDGEKFKIARGVTSFKTPTADKNRGFSKLRLVEIMDLHQKDIRKTYDEYYLGKYPNDWDHKRNFCDAVDMYLSSFTEAPTLCLNPNYVARMVIDTKRQKEWLIANGKLEKEEATKMTSLDIDKADTMDKGFYRIENYKPLDVMEDIDINVYL